MPRAAHERGAVLVAVLLALLLLAGLVFYVFNLGRAAQQRVAAQAAADATAHAGGAWVARSMNQVALNNIAMARTIAMVNILDAMPMAIGHTHVDQLALVDAIESQLRRGIPDNLARQDVRELLDDVREDVAELAEVNALLSGPGFDVRAYTWYDGPTGRGHCWRAMESLDAASTATLAALADAAQATAIDAGRANLRESAGPVALMLPATVEIPYLRGKFDDFEPVLGSDDHFGGLTMRAVETARDNDWHRYRGPFDTVFGWRWLYYPGRIYRSAQGNVPITSVSWLTQDADPTDYRTYGPQAWMIGWLATHSHLTGSRFARHPDDRYNSYMHWVNRLARIKLRYLWPGDTTQQVHRPAWENDYSRARAIAESDRRRIRATRLLVHVIRSTAPRAAGYGAVESHGVHVRYFDRWVDPGGWPIDKVASDVWRDEWSYDPEEGTTSYMTYHYIFAGVDVGEEEVEVDNPHNFTDRSALPAPTDFDYQFVPPDDVTRRRYFTYLGVVRQDGRSTLWPDRFDREEGSARVALAQVRVFNNHSWDMWTPMWQAQLEPITGYDDWLSQYRADVSVLVTEPQLVDAPLGELGDYLASLKPLVDALGMEH